MYTKGEWRAETNLFPGTVWAISKGRETEVATIHPQPNNQDFANAQLIVEAVNACIKLNPDNPLAVAQSISDLYEALKELLKLAYDYEPGPLVATITGQAIKALAKAEEVL